MKTAGLLLLYLVLTLAFFPTQAMAMIVGYYPGWGTYEKNYQVTDIDGSKLTHINYGFANVLNGEVALGDPYADTEKVFPGDCQQSNCKHGNFNQLTKLKTQYPQIKTLISVGGWTWSSNFSEVASTAAGRNKFADSSVTFIRTWGFDGVDIDWEFPVSGGMVAGRPEDKANFTLFLATLRSKLNAASTSDGKQYLLTIAAGATPSYAQNVELSQISQYLDYINIMAYDFHGSWDLTSGHNAPLFNDSADPNTGNSALNIDSAVRRFIQAGIPANKLVMGIPFYGRNWAGCSGGTNGQYTQCTSIPPGSTEPGVLNYTDLESSYINKNGYTRSFNNSAKVPYLFNASTKTFVSYDDVESIAQKVSYIKSLGLKGAMVWELSQDRNKVLLTKLNSDLSNSVPGLTCPVLGDITDPCDNNITLLDFNWWLAEYLGEKNTRRANLNPGQDSEVTLLDFTIWLDEYLKGS